MVLECTKKELLQSSANPQYMAKISQVFIPYIVCIYHFATALFVVTYAVLLVFSKITFQGDNLLILFRFMITVCIRHTAETVIRILQLIIAYQTAQSRCLI